MSGWKTSGNIFADAGEHIVKRLFVHVRESFRMFLVFAAALEQFGLLRLAHPSLTSQFVTMIVKPFDELRAFFRRQRFDGGFNLFHAHALNFTSSDANWE